jgi:hypothetical protein
MVVSLKGRDARRVRRVVVRHRGKVAARGRRRVTILLEKLRRSGRVRVVARLGDGRKRSFEHQLTLCSRRR